MRLYVITTNEGKLREFKELGKSYGIEVAPAGFGKLELQSSSLEEIASFSALMAYLKLREPVFAEDAGLFINSLKGFPGPYSSYVYRTIGVEGVLKLMEGVKDRRACFKSAISLVIPGVTLKVFRGEVCGQISKEVRGARGFGFDPIFVPDGHSRSFAEMNLSTKNSLSHRAKAFRSMVEWLSNNF